MIWSDGPTIDQIVWYCPAHTRESLTIDRARSIRMWIVCVYGGHQAMRKTLLSKLVLGVGAQFAYSNAQSYALLLQKFEKKNTQN